MPCGAPGRCRGLDCSQPCDGAGVSYTAERLAAEVADMKAAEGMGCHHAADYFRRRAAVLACILIAGRVDK